MFVCHNKSKYAIKLDTESSFKGCDNYHVVRKGRWKNSSVVQRLNVSINKRFANAKQSIFIVEAFCLVTRHYRFIFNSRLFDA